MVKQHIPNILTLGNLTCGCIGILSCSKGDLYTAAYMIWVAAIFDFFDGFVARLLHVASPIGKELDSLADMVTFGVLPAFILYNLQHSLTTSLLPYVSFLVALFAALRLAKFNVDKSQTYRFIGMPTPAVAFFVSGLPFWPENSIFINSTTSILAITILLSLLMVAPIPMLALKFKDYTIKDNIYRYLIIIVSVVFFIIFGKKSFPLLITTYVGLSLILSLRVNKGNV